MGQRIHLILGSHHHIPWGSGDDEFEELYSRELKPLSAALYRFPRISMVFHYSGVLLQWLEGHHKEFLLFLKDLISRRQIELLGGGFYEPLFPLLPQPDRISQIEMFSAYLRRLFGKRPSGCWLPVLAWEQNLAAALNTSGMAYTFLSDGAFAAAGGEQQGDLYYTPCITEDQGKSVTVFPLAHGIEKVLAREPPSRMAALLATVLPVDKEQVLTVFPERLRGEGEKPPELFYHEFFEALSEIDPRFEFALPGRVYRGLKTPGKLYFPSSIDRGEDYCHLPRKILTTYPEAKGIYSKMMFTHVLINQLRGDKARKRSAREELWKAQGGDLFYTGREAGNVPLYRQTLRKAVYRALLEAEKISRGKGNFIPSLSGFDFDFDGREKYIFQGDPLNCYIQMEGAAVFELDYLPRSWNYLDTFQTAGRRRTAFSDYLLPEMPPEGSLLGDLPGTRFCGAECFGVVEMDRVKGMVHFRLPVRQDLSLGMVELEKTYCLKKDSLAVEYVLRNRGTDPVGFVLSPHIELSFPGEGEDYLSLVKRPVDPVMENNSFKTAEALEFQDRKNEVLIVFLSSQPFSGRIFPIYAGENGAAAYQSTCLAPLFPVHLEAGELWQAEFRLRFSLIRPRPSD